MTTPEPIPMNRLNQDLFKNWPFDQDHCLTCAICSGSCPVSGIDGFDPRKIIRMVSLGLQSQLVESRWPWICTMCGKCEHVCPMGIHIPDLMRAIRSLRDRDKVPGILHKGLEAALKTGNNLGLPKEDFVFILEDVADEIAAGTRIRRVYRPVDKEGCQYPDHHSQQAGEYPDRRSQALVENFLCGRRRLDHSLRQLGRHQLGHVYRR